MTFSIGTPFARNAGYHWNGREKGKDENDVQTCPHCQAVILMQEWRKAENGKMTGGFCMRCSAPICGPCNKRMAYEGCIPFMAKIDREMDATVKYQQFLKDAGLAPVPARPVFTGLVLSE